MPKVILEIHARSDAGVPTLWARDVRPAASVIPDAGEEVIFQTAEIGNSQAVRYKVTRKAYLASLDGYLLEFWVPAALLAEDKDGMKLRAQLMNLDWDFVTPAPRLPYLADEDDLDDED